jgi:choline dehydrogenase-like flavoprotein
MWLSQKLAKFSLAILPLSGRRERTEEASEYCLRNLPTTMRLVFIAIFCLLAIVAFFLRRGEKNHSNAMAGWVGSMLNARWMLVRVVGLWLKTTACLIVLVDRDNRRSLYMARDVPLPSQYPAPKIFTLPSEPDLDLEADYIIVGTGPAGATVARTLAQAGHRVMLLEEGSHMPKLWQADSTMELLGTYFRDSALLTTLGSARIPILQGRVVGGSSVINCAIVRRLPDDVFTQWHEDAALREHLTEERVHKAYDTLEQSLQISDSAPLGANSILFKEGADKLGISASAINRYVSKDCQGLGRCLEGCPRGAKQAMHLTFLPQAVAAGAKIYSQCRVERVVLEGNRATGVHAHYLGKKRFFRAKHGVIVAASAIQTPLILKASGVRHASLGERFQAHPGVSVSGVFDKPIRVDPLGATQGYESFHYRQSSNFKLETMTLPDEMLATRFPGVGQDFLTSLQDISHTAGWAAIIRVKALGSVRGSQRLPLVHYNFSRADEMALGKAIKTLVDLMFAAGAKEVIPSVLGLPSRIQHPRQAQSLLLGVHPNRVGMIASHLFGTAFMGGEHAVCDAYGHVRGTTNLYVADSSLFPSIGINPQHTIMAVAQHVAWGILEGRQA